MRLAVAAFLLPIIFGPALCQNSDPDFVREYRDITRDMRWVEDQPYLPVLIEKREGNCSAFAKLAVLIAIKYRLSHQVFRLKPKDEWWLWSWSDRGKHLVVVIRSRDGRLWLTTNDSVRQIKFVSDIVNWDYDRNWEIFERTWFVGKNLEWSIAPKSACLGFL